MDYGGGVERDGEERKEGREGGVRRRGDGGEGVVAVNDNLHYLKVTLVVIG